MAAVVLLAALVAACSGDDERASPGYVLHRPASGEEPAALILAFHATGSDVDRFEEISRMHGYAPDAAVAYLEGVDGAWSADDVDRAARVVDELAEEGVADPDRVHLVGFSGGGMMALRIAAVDGASYRAVAAVASQLPVGVAPAARIPAVLFYGSDDPLRPFDGLEDGPAPTIGSRATARSFAVVGAPAGDDVVVPPDVLLPDADPDDGTRVSRQSWGGLSTVDLYVVEGGGHTWPGTTEPTSRQRYGRTSNDIDASAVIVEFFRDHGALDGDG